MNYLFITTYCWINIEAFMTILNRIDIESWLRESKSCWIVRFLRIPSPSFTSNSFIHKKRQRDWLVWSTAKREFQSPVCPCWIFYDIKYNSITNQLSWNSLKCHRLQWMGLQKRLEVFWHLLRGLLSRDGTLMNSLSLLSCPTKSSLPSVIICPSFPPSCLPSFFP